MLPSGTAKLGLAAQSPTVNRLIQTMGVNPFADVNQRVYLLGRILSCFVSFGSLS